MKGLLLALLTLFLIPVDLFANKFAHASLPRRLSLASHTSDPVSCHSPQMGELRWHSSCYRNDCAPSA
jgi:hypothetical protein